jgi:dihydroorotate dehydrogenase (NAD+) catalytic subunit
MIEIELFGKKMKNPTILASGILGVTKESLERVAREGAGAVTTKSLTLEPRAGHAGPNIIETDCGLINAMGYPNPGIKEGLKEFSDWKLKEPLVISIAGKDEKEFSKLADAIEKSKIKCTAIEAAISCPHTPGYGLMAGQSAPESVSKTVTAIKKRTKIPLVVKLSPSAPGGAAAARAAEKAGADAINMGNTVGPGMRISLERKKRILGFGCGGLSGPAMKPIAIRCVYDIYEAVKIPVIGTGGVTTGEDLIEYMMAGASAVGIGTAVHYRGLSSFRRISNEARTWLDDNGYKDISEIIGAAHD